MGKLIIYKSGSAQMDGQFDRFFEVVIGEVLAEQGLRHPGVVQVAG